MLSHTSFNHAFNEKNYINKQTVTNNDENLNKMILKINNDDKKENNNEKKNDNIEKYDNNDFKSLKKHNKENENENLINFNIMF